MLLFLFLATCFLAYSNGANDNFKGVASLYGSGTCSYRTALGWATLTTFAGSVCSVLLAATLLKQFSGKGLVPDAIAGSPSFLLAVALGAGLTVILATVLGFPVSTTHGLMGAILGAGLVAVGADVRLGVLGKSFVLPLLLSPFLAVVVASVWYSIFHRLRLQLGITKESCACLGEVQPAVSSAHATSSTALTGETSLVATVDDKSRCMERYVGHYVGVDCQQAMDVAHFLSAGVVSFARGLNDTPKMAALLLLIPALGIQSGMMAVAVAIAVGGCLNARRVAETMSQKITGMNHGQGLTANLTTGLLVTLASVFGWPVSTTHVSCGALFGIGWNTGQADRKVIAGILLSWVVTLPCAALLGALAFWLFNHSL